MYLTIQGLVLRVTTYNDTDALLTVLTKDKGKLTLKARGLRRKNSPLTAPCQLLGYSNFTLFENKGYYTINEASVIELFHPLRKDLQKLSLATYFAQVADVMSQEDIPNPQLLSLLLNCIYGLCKLSVTEKQIKAVFELRIAVLGGYEPDLHGCYKCGCAYPDRFHLSEGHLECGDCRNTNRGYSVADLARHPGCHAVYLSVRRQKAIFFYCRGGKPGATVTDNRGLSCYSTGERFLYTGFLQNTFDIDYRSFLCLHFMKSHC